MRDPVEIFAETYRVWEPTPKPSRVNPVVLWPALAAAASIAFLFWCQAMPGDKRKAPTHEWVRRQIERAKKHDDEIGADFVVKEKRA
jgi:hypothetical protein